MGIAYPVGAAFVARDSSTVVGPVESMRKLLARTAGSVWSTLPLPCIGQEPVSASRRLRGRYDGRLAAVPSWHNCRQRLHLKCALLPPLAWRLTAPRPQGHRRRQTRRPGLRTRLQQPGQESPPATGASGAQAVGVQGPR